MRRHDTASRVGQRAAVIAAAVFVTYGNALDGPFIFDDRPAIVDNTSIRELGSRAVIDAEREVPTAGHPVVNLSFALN